MKKNFTVDRSFDNARIDRWIRHNFKKIPQGLIEKNLRIGKIKINKKKVKSSHKVKHNDIIEIFNLEIKDNVTTKKTIKFEPSKDVIKSNENLIIDNNDDFIVVNKEAGIAVQGGTKSKKNLIDIFAKSEIFENTRPYTVHRLDKETTGIIIVAKNSNIASKIGTLFQERKISKSFIR